ncbi:MAG: VIT domain-containing protein, partial [Planctomycetota bacterium]
METPKAKPERRRHVFPLPLITALLAAAIISPAPSSAEDEKGFRITAVDGSAAALDPAKGAFVPLFKDRVLSATEWRTGPLGSVTLQTGTTLITLARGARARLINGKDALQGELLTGEILVRPEGETEAVVKTPFGTARSKGKAFRIAVDLTGMDVTALGNDVRLTCGGQTTVMRKEDRKRVGNASLSLPDLPDVAARKPGPGVVFTPNARSEKPSPLPVEDLTVHVIFDGPFVCTRVDQTFVNETNCGRKGSFTFPLPKGASVSRVAVWPKGKSLIEGEIVEKNHGRRFYDAAVRNRRDLTLWGWRKGNLFRVQDVEIAARSHTRILLEYRQI